MSHQYFYAAARFSTRSLQIENDDGWSDRCRLYLSHESELLWHLPLNCEPEPSDKSERNETVASNQWEEIVISHWNVDFYVSLYCLSFGNFCLKCTDCAAARPALAIGVLVVLSPSPVLCLFIARFAAFLIWTRWKLNSLLRASSFIPSCINLLMIRMCINWHRIQL